MYPVLKELAILNLIFNKNNILKTKGNNKFEIKKNQQQLKDKTKFSQIGKAYMTEYSKFQYKVDTIINDAYLYVKELKPRPQADEKSSQYF